MPQHLLVAAEWACILRSLVATPTTRSEQGSVASLARDEAAGMKRHKKALEDTMPETIPQRFSRRVGRAGSVLGAALLFPGLATASAPAELAAVPQLKDLVEMTVEQLSSITVSTVARREQVLSQTAADVYVITHEDIRRSGATSLPEALRLAPNLQVARADANQYAISARGFNNILANKLLVMIDGRTVYSPLFSGVFWEVQHVMLEDVERIEVIAGPGATLWGANAVNGVVNIITRPSGQTLGGLIAAGGGNRETAGSVRWGGHMGEDATFRVYASGHARDNSNLQTGPAVRDESDLGQAGFRADWGTRAQGFTLQGDIYRADIDQAFGGSRDLAGGNLLARWTRQLATDSSLRVQAYYDRVERDQPGAILERLDTWDLEIQHGFALGERHRMLWGGGYRYMHDELTNIGTALAFVPGTQELHRGYVFAQNEISLSKQVDLTLGLKLEHNNYSGWETLPNVRLAWRVSDEHFLWSSVARAVRAPSRVDREFFQPPNPPFLIAGGSGFDSEVANVFEVGYRAQPLPTVSYSITAYHHDFDRLRTLEPRPGGLRVENRMEGRLNGVTAWGHYRVTDNWRINAGYTRLWQDLDLKSGSASIGGVAAAGNDPRYWSHIGSSLNIAPGHELDLRIRRVGALPSPSVPAYTAVDVRYGWKIRRDLELSLTVQNLFDKEHVEWGPATNRAVVERSAFVKILWTM
jgi:iron complex outermembrane receptor protein